MELVQFDRQYYIRISDLMTGMNMDKDNFRQKKERYTFECKPLELLVLDRKPSVSCKSACDFMQWYLDNTYGCHPDVSQFKHSLAKKYAKKIPKRVFSRTMRIELAYRQRYCCNHCRVLLPPDFQVDHIQPIENAGEDTPDNLQCLCVACHAHKTRLERLLKTKLFHGDAQKEYTRLYNISMEARKHFIGIQTPANEQPSHICAAPNMSETDDFLQGYDDDSEEDMTEVEESTPVFSKYFLRNNETDQKK